MQKKSISNPLSGNLSQANPSDDKDQFLDSAIECVNWSNSLALNDTVIALQTTRGLGSDVVSTSCYDKFNLGLHVGDNPDSVLKNRLSLKQFINQYPNSLEVNNPATDDINIQWLEQVHGNEVVYIEQASDKALIADASITRERNVALAIMTADCLPILLCNSDGSEIAAIHGGWRPLAANIIEKTIDKMQSETNEVKAWLGPCIGNTAFEVGQEVKNTFNKLDIRFNEAFTKQLNEKYIANLKLIAELQLSSLGVKHISISDKCTYLDENKFYSYRREHVTGRMATVICRR